MKKVLTLSILILLLTVLSSCNNDITGEKTVDFKYSETDYNFKKDKVSLYFYDNTKYPYISVSEFFNLMDGYYQTSLCQIEENENNAIIKYEDYSITFDASSDQIKGNPDLFSFHVENNNNYDYSYYLSSKEEYFGDENEYITYDLAKYNIDIKTENNKVLVPLSIMNTLFNSSGYLNLYYTTDVVASTSIDSDINCRLNNKNTNTYYRELVYNEILFDLDYFYGLKEYKGINNFKDSISNTIKNEITSTNVLKNNQGYIDLFAKYLNEGHTYISNFSLYNNGDVSNSYLTYSSFGTWYQDTILTYYSLNSSNEKSKMNYEIINPSTKESIRYSDDLAVIELNSFKTGTKEERNSSENYLYDSFYYVKYCLEKIDEKSNIKNVIIDLTRNGGGNLGSLIRVLGLITDKDIKTAVYDKVSNVYDVSVYQVDVDGDSIYDNDSYESKYTFYLMSSSYSYSCANLACQIVKDNNICKIIGEKSGGGMCAITPIVLPDGATIYISSNTLLQGVVYNDSISFYNIEDGVDVDFNLSTNGYTNEYDRFYDDKMLSTLIKAYNA